MSTLHTALNLDELELCSFSLKPYAAVLKNNTILVFYIIIIVKCTMCFRRPQNQKLVSNGREADVVNPKKEIFLAMTHGDRV